MMRSLAMTVLILSLSACGFHLQGEMQFPSQLRRLYLQSSDPHGQLVRNLKSYFKMSNVQLVSSPEQATAILDIVNEDASQHFLSVNGTQQTRQYNLVVSATFQITNGKGLILAGPETLSESKPITIQSNQILGSSNEAGLYYNHMRRTLAYAIMNRISSGAIAKKIYESEHPTPKPKSL